MPVKLNRSYWKNSIFSKFPGAWDPRALLETTKLSDVDFTRMVSMFSFNGIYKTSKKNRYPLTMEYLLDTKLSENAVILEIGASDGCASLDLIQKLKYKKYFVTDANIEVRSKKIGADVYFYDANDNCILAVNDKFVVYPDVQNAYLPFKIYSQNVFAEAPHSKDYDGGVLLINPLLSDYIKNENEKVSVKKFNIFESWEYEKADFLIAANILNRSNFSEQDFKLIAGNLKQAMNPQAKLVIIDNRDVESSTLISRNNDEFKVSHEVNGGAEIKQTFLDLLNQA